MLLRINQVIVGGHDDPLKHVDCRYKHRRDSPLWSSLIVTFELCVRIVVLIIGHYFDAKLIMDCGITVRCLFGTKMAVILACLASCVALY
jgi:hypothetical protein